LRDSHRELDEQQFLSTLIEGNAVLLWICSLVDGFVPRWQRCGVEQVQGAVQCLKSRHNGFIFSIVILLSFLRIFLLEAIIVRNMLTGPRKKNSKSINTLCPVHNIKERVFLMKIFT
jgi:hypothetical protein